MEESEVDLLCEIVISKLPPHVQKTAASLLNFSCLETHFRTLIVDSVKLPIENCRRLQFASSVALAVCQNKFLISKDCKSRSRSVNDMHPMANPDLQVSDGGGVADDFVSS